MNRSILDLCPIREICTGSTFHTKPLLNVDGGHALVNSSKEKEKKKPLCACPV